MRCQQCVLEMYHIPVHIVTVITFYLHCIGMYVGVCHITLWGYYLYNKVSLLNYVLSHAAVWMKVASPEPFDRFLDEGFEETGLFRHLLMVICFYTEPC